MRSLTSTFTAMRGAAVATVGFTAARAGAKVKAGMIASALVFPELLMQERLCLTAMWHQAAMYARRTPNARRKKTQKAQVATGGRHPFEVPTVHVRPYHIDRHYRSLSGQWWPMLVHELVYCSSRFSGLMEALKLRRSGGSPGCVRCPRGRGQNAGVVPGHPKKQSMILGDSHCRMQMQRLLCRTGKWQVCSTNSLAVIL